MSLFIRALPKDMIFRAFIAYINILLKKLPEGHDVLYESFLSVKIRKKKWKKQLN